jgi:hypothetical protein
MLVDQSELLLRYIVPPCARTQVCEYGLSFARTDASSESIQRAIAAES